MTKKIKKIGDEKVTSVTAATGTKNVEGTQAVSGVSGVKAAGMVGAVRRTGGVGGARQTRSMSLAEREELFRMIDQEADKLFADSGIAAAKRKVVESAVKMAIDAGLLPGEEEEGGKKKG